MSPTAAFSFAIRSIAAIVLSLSNTFAVAGADTWTGLPTYGGIVQALAIDPTNNTIVYAGTQGSGVFKSTDGGNTWNHAHGGLEDGDVQALAIDPTDTNRLYAGTADKGIYRSTDGGDNWLSINSGLDNLSVYKIAIDPITPTTIYAAAFGNLFASADRGDTWTALGTPSGTGASQNLYDSAAYDVVVVPNTIPTLLVATHARGVFKYSAGSWSSVWTDTRANPDPLINNVRALVSDAGADLAVTADDSIFIGTQGLGLFKSTDGGTTWPTQVSNASGLTTTVLRTLAMLPGDTTNIYAGTANGFYYSRNGGAAWNEASTEMNVLAIAIDPGAVSTVYAGTDQGVYKSTDGGANFTQQNDGLLNLKVRDIAIDSTDASRRYAAIYGGGVMKSADSGATWSYVNTSLASKDAIAIAVGPRDDTSRNLIVGLDRNGAFRSTDDGASWASIDPGLSTKHISQIAADQSTPGHFFAGTRAGFLATQDAGNVWSVEIDGIAGDDYLEVNALAVDPSNPEIVWGAVSSRGIYRGTHNPDESIAWNPVNAGFTGDFVSAVVVDPTNSDILYSGTIGRGIFKTIDRGVTWVQSTEGMGEESVNSIVIDPATPSTLYASTQDSGVFKSTNSGATWVAINGGMENFNVTTLALDSSTTPPTLYAGTDGDGVMEIQSTASSPAPALVVGEQSNGGGGVDLWLALLPLLGLARRRAILH